MICGVELLCDNCLPLGPQISHRFRVCRDNEDGAPVIQVVCPTCNEVLDHVFIGVGTLDDRSQDDGGNDPHPTR